MRYFNYLKAALRIYIISGVVFGFAVFLSIIVYRYNGYLFDTLQIVENISINKEKVKDQTHEMDAVIKYLTDDLKLDLTDVDGERLILQSLDNIKTRLKDASITVTTFEETNGQKRLPVEIKTSAQTYKKLIDYVEYIESFRIPEYKINQISISKGQEGDIILNIKGVIITPSL